MVVCGLEIRTIARCQNWHADARNARRPKDRNTASGRCEAENLRRRDSRNGFGEGKNKSRRPASGGCPVRCEFEVMNVKRLKKVTRVTKEETPFRCNPCNCCNVVTL